MTDSSGWQLIPTHLRPFRDKLRISGFDLVRISAWEAKDRALKYPGHNPCDYEYTIYRIAYIDEASGQVYLRGSSESSHYFSESTAPAFVDSHLEHNTPAPLRQWLLKWLKDTDTGRAVGLITLLVPPYGLTLLGFMGIGNYREIREARRRAQLLPRLLDMPRFA